MHNSGASLTDSFGRTHNYLRISLTERCNLRCFYCMPPEGITLSPPESIMQAGEIYRIAAEFVKRGVTKIRLTGGEPLVRKDLPEILGLLAQLKVELAITTNGILLDKYLDLFKRHAINKINISLDSLQSRKFNQITRRNYFERVWDNIHLLLNEGMLPKINVVLIKGVNDDEIKDFVRLTRELPVTVQFIEFMPFVGNKWQRDKTIYAREVLGVVQSEFGEENLLRLADGANDTAKNYKISGYRGSFGLINTVSNPFCDSCNRIRLTANGRIKNCLFSQSETDLLSLLRQGGDLGEAIRQNVLSKSKLRGGITDFNDREAVNKVLNNRSMVLIGG